jgi:prepilin-type processing-associated H-X9-DG protein
MNEPGGAELKPQKRFSLFRVLIGVLIGVAVLACLIPPPTIPRRQANRIRCMTNLRSLTAAVSIYADEHGGAYPPVRTWCDSIMARYVDEGFFRCRGGGPGRSHYAMNPQADSNSAPDVVWLFECSGGWNQSGGPELLTTGHHENKGCCVSFADGHVQFIKAEEIPRLRWGGTDQ